MSVRIYPAPTGKANIVYWTEHAEECPVCVGTGVVQLSRLGPVSGGLMAAFAGLVVDCPFLGWPPDMVRLLAEGGGPRATA